MHLQAARSLTLRRYRFCPFRCSLRDFARPCALGRDRWLAKPAGAVALCFAPRSKVSVMRRPGILSVAENFMPCSSATAATKPDQALFQPHWCCLPPGRTCERSAPVQPAERPSRHQPRSPPVASHVSRARPLFVIREAYAVSRYQEGLPASRRADLLPPKISPMEQSWRQVSCPHLLPPRRTPPRLSQIAY